MGHQGGDIRHYMVGRARRKHRAETGGVHGGVEVVKWDWSPRKEREARQAGVQADHMRSSHHGGRAAASEGPPPCPFPVCPAPLPSVI